MTLSAAQLAVAREYGYSSWLQLKTEVERVRSTKPEATQSNDIGGSVNPLDAPSERWSLGGASAIEIAEGVFSPGALVVESDQATLTASLVPSVQPGGWRIRRSTILGQRLGLPVPGRRPEWVMPDLADLSVVDDRGACYRCHVSMASGGRRLSGDPTAPIHLHLQLEPVPPRGIGWLELRSGNGSTTRLAPASRAGIEVSSATALAGNSAEREILELAQHLIELRLFGRSAGGKKEYFRRQCSEALIRASEIQQSGELGARSELPDQLAALCVSLTEGGAPAGLPASWARMLNSAKLTDAPRHHLELGGVLPPLDGVVLRLDTLISGSDAWDSWRVYLGATPGWWVYSEDHRSKRSPLSIIAQDDRGGTYVSIFDGSTGHGSHEDLILRFRPRLDPVANTLQFRVRGSKEEVVVDIELAPGTG
jgi:hypothetical protein